MRKKIAWLMTGIMITTALLAGCAQKTDEKEKVEKETQTETQAEKETQKETQNGNTQEYSLESENVYDGINRIAITLYGDTTTQMGLSWYTPYKENFGNDIEVIDKTTMKLQNIEYEVEADKGEYDETSMYHQTVIKGLNPGTEYYYRIGDKNTNQWSEYGTFKTSSDDMTNYTFVAVTDTQNQHLADAYYAADTLERAVAKAGDPAFIMHGGDFVDDGDEEYLWLAQMNTAKNTLMNNIIAPAVGNHEYDNHSFWQHFKLEHTNGHKTTGVYYSYDYGNVHFVVLDTNKSNDENTSYIDDEQLEWLEEDLKKANENGARWIIVNMHKGLYTLGEHADNEKFAGEEGSRLRVGTILEKYGVDLVMQGHDHCPSVTKPIKQGEISDDGVVYINTGSAGVKAYGVEEDSMPDEYYQLFDYKAPDEREDDTYQNFAIVDVTEDKLTVTMYEVNMLAIENNMYVLKTVEIN